MPHFRRCRPLPCRNVATLQRSKGSGRQRGKRTLLKKEYMIMRKLLFAAAATVALATPAVAKDGSPYVGLDAGLLIPQKQDVFGSIDFTNPAVADLNRTDVASLKYKLGYDVDLVGGYDFGMFRLEGELGYKHAKTK